MKKPEVRSEELLGAIATAFIGKTDNLFRFLEIHSGLPGPRMNDHLAVGFALECARIGSQSDALLKQMASLPPNEARGASTKEFLSVCGVLGTAARAASIKDKAAREKAVLLLEEMAEDVRFRVRDSVPMGLAMLGAVMKDDLADRVEPWMDRYFQAAAVIRALAEPAWLETFPLEDYYAPINLMHAAFMLAHGAPRSAFRYPGHKALVEALSSAPKALARRFRLPMYDRYMIWASGVQIPELREVILANVDDSQMKKAFGPDIKRIREAVEGSKKPPRDPTRLVKGMRGRGRKRDAL